MKQELIGPTATLAGAMLSKIEFECSDFTRNIVAKTFEEAYFTLLEGIQRVDAAEAALRAEQTQHSSLDEN